MGIGNYIHYDYQNYKTYGLQRTAYRFLNDDGEIVYKSKANKNSFGLPNRPDSADFLAKKQEILLWTELMKIKSKYSPATLQKLTDKINFFYGHSSYNGETISKELKKNMENAMLKMLEKENKNLKIDFSNLSISENCDLTEFYQNLEEKQKQKLKELKQISLDTNGLYGKLLSQIQNFYILRDKLDPKKSQELINSIDNLIEKWKQVRYVFNHKNGNIDIKKDFLSDLKVISNSFDMKNTIEWKGRILEMALGLQEYAIAKGALIGTEELLAFAQKNFNKLAGKKSQKGLQKKYFSTFVDFDKLIYKTKGWDRKYTVDDFGLYTVKATYDKVDLTIDIDDMKIPVSVKNYNLQNTVNIHFLTGKSWIRLVQEYGDFVNHYLNIVPLRKGAKTRKIQAPSNDVNPMLKAMKLTIFLKAIIGRDIAKKGLTDTAELLIMNDTTPGKVGQMKVYHIVDLYNKAFMHPDYIVLNDTINNPNKISNTWVSRKRDATSFSDATQERITKMIRTMQNRRIDVQVSKLIL